MEIMKRYFKGAIKGTFELFDVALIRSSALEEMKRELAKRSQGTPDQQERFLCLARHFQPVAVENIPKIRVGCNEDGGYVMLNKLDEVVCALSFGVGKEISWDTAMANRGCPIFMFDHTVDGPPENNPQFVFHKKMLGSGEGPGMTSIESALRDHGAPGRRNVLKIDIEGEEWAAFDATSRLALERFSQIVCEFHNFSYCSDRAWLARALRVMEKLSSCFVVVHVHGNNYLPYSIISNVPFPEALEVTLVNRDNIFISTSSECFPSALDRPNASSRPDLVLGRFQFA
jgi:hypothetical protein